jgi:NADP-dependent 3-hydroxy acid dehydrogenase YdfG
MRSLSGMVVIITGASAGIGESLAKHLDAAGARLALAARRKDLLDALPVSADHLRMPVDVADSAACAELVEATVARFGRIDTVVANAGYGFFSPVAECGDDQWNAIWRTNVMGTVSLVRAALPHLRRNDLQDRWRGQVMAVSSGLARRAMPDMAAYSATKAAQLSFCEALRVELRDERIAVTSVHPVTTRSRFFAVADQVSGQVWKRAPGLREPVQEVDAVAAAMVKAIRKPRPECWPYPLARWMTGLGSLWPSLGDRIMHRHRRRPQPGDARVGP